MRFKMICLTCALALTNITFTSNVAHAAAARATQASSYVVRSGDCLSSISHKVKVSIKKLKELNHLKNDRLDIGQKLRISTTLTKSINSNQLKASTQKNTIARTAKVSRSFTGQRVIGELIPWEEANKLYSEGKIATVYDLDSGLSFKVKRNRGHYHADSDPLTSGDTKILKRIFGGAWSWNRKAVVIEVDGRLLAASINGMPHGNKLVNDNNFPGHFCIHFLGSKTHGSSYTKTGLPTVDKEHQAMVRKAAGL